MNAKFRNGTLGMIFCDPLETDAGGCDVQITTGAAVDEFNEVEVDSNVDPSSLPVAQALVETSTSTTTPIPETPSTTTIGDNIDVGVGIVKSMSNELKLFL